MALLASRSGTLLNAAEMSRSAGTAYTTLQRYLTLFETAYLIHRIRPWTTNLSKRLVKAPKLLLGDTGLMGYLLNASEATLLDGGEPAGRFLETFVGCELLKQIEWSDTRPTFLHYRTASGAEVDFVLEERGGRLGGVEVKLTHTIRSDDFRGLRSLAQDAGPRFAGGVILYFRTSVHSLRPPALGDPSVHFVGMKAPRGGAVARRQSRRGSPDYRDALSGRAPGALLPGS